MSKAPAFQFYFDRFNSSTALWDDCQVGQYIRLMICQANKGYVSAKEIKKVVHDNDPDVLSKFIEVEPGKFVNGVLDEVLKEREAHRKKQQENGSKGGRPITQKEPNNNPDQNPNQNPDVTSTTTTTSSTTSNPITTTTTTKKNRANAPEIPFDFLPIIPSSWDVAHFEKLVAGWIYARRKKPPTEYAKELAITDLVRYFPDWDKAKDRMEKAIKGGWLDLVFAEDKVDQSKPKGRYENERGLKFDKA